MRRRWQGKIVNQKFCLKLQQIYDLQVIYIDDTRVESNNATLSGVIEVHIDSPYIITCTKILDQMTNGTGAMPSYNSGGSGEKFVFINVQGQEGYGIHFRIVIRGILKETEQGKKANEVWSFWRRKLSWSFAKFIRTYWIWNIME